MIIKVLLILSLLVAAVLAYRSPLSSRNAALSIRYYLAYNSGSVAGRGGFDMTANGGTLTESDGTIQNIGGELSYIESARAAKVPTVFRVGASMGVLETANSNLLLAGEFSHPPDNSERVNVGGEYAFKDFFFARGGLNLGYDAEKFAAGLGVKFPTSLSTETRFDYSYTDMSDLGGVHRFSLIIRF